jgi:hypothetical protein
MVGSIDFPNPKDWGLRVAAVRQQPSQKRRYLGDMIPMEPVDISGINHGETLALKLRCGSDLSQLIKLTFQGTHLQLCCSTFD